MTAAGHLLSPVPAVSRGGGDDELAHIVSGWQDLLDRLGLKIPRALCGVLLAGDPGRAGPGRGSPVCPRCEALARGPS